MKALKTYFRGNKRFGRTTTLVSKEGTKLIECMGVCTLRQMVAAYQREIAKA